MALKNNLKQLTPREKCLGRYKTARGTLLAILLLTVVSIITTLTTEDGTYFVFSASIPRFMVFWGMLFCGKYDKSVYEELGATDFVPYDNGVLIALTVVALILTALYFVCWLLSSNGKKVGIIIGIVLFSIDTLGLIVLFGIANNLVDFVMHVLILVYLIMGLVGINKLNSMPPEAVVVEIEENIPNDERNV